MALASVAMAAAVLDLRRARGAAVRSRRRRDEVPLIGETLRLFRLPVFHLLLWSYTICGFTTSGIIEVHLLPYAAACGFPPLESAYCLWRALGGQSRRHGALGLADGPHEPAAAAGLDLYPARALPSSC